MNTPNHYAPRPPAMSPLPGVAADAEFSVFAILADAWTLSDGCKGLFLGLYAIVFVVMWLAQWVAISALGLGASVSGPLGLLAWQVLAAAFVYPFLAGVMALALRRVDGLPVRASDVLGHGVPLPQVVLLGALLTLATTAGFALLLLPGLYLSVALMFALPLLVDRRLGAVAALTTSWRAVHPRWFRCAGLMCLLGVMLALGSMIFIGLIWALPVSSLALAVAYRRLFPATAGAAP